MEEDHFYACLDAALHDSRLDDEFGRSNGSPYIEGDDDDVIHQTTEKMLVDLNHINDLQQLKDRFRDGLMIMRAYNSANKALLRKANFVDADDIPERLKFMFSQPAGYEHEWFTVDNGDKLKPVYKKYRLLSHTDQSGEQEIDIHLTDKQKEFLEREIGRFLNIVSGATMLREMVDSFQRLIDDLPDAETVAKLQEKLDEQHAKIIYLESQLAQSNEATKSMPRSSTRSGRSYN